MSARSSQFHLPIPSRPLTPADVPSTWETELQRPGCYLVARKHSYAYSIEFQPTNAHGKTYTGQYGFGMAIMAADGGFDIQSILIAHTTLYNVLLEAEKRFHVPLRAWYCEAGEE